MNMQLNYRYLRGLIIKKNPDRKYSEISFNKGNSYIESELNSNATIITNSKDTYLMDILERFYLFNTWRTKTSNTHFAWKEVKFTYKYDKATNNTSRSEDYLNITNDIIDALDGDSIKSTFSNLNFADPKLRPKNFEYEINDWSTANSILKDLRNSSNAVCGLYRKTQTLKTPKVNRTKRRIQFSNKTKIISRKITLGSLPVKDVLEMLEMYYTFYSNLYIFWHPNGAVTFKTEYLEPSIYDLDPVRNISNMIAKALFDFSVEYSLSFKVMSWIFQNGQYFSRRGYVDEYVIEPMRNHIREDSITREILNSPYLSDYVDHVLHESITRFGLGFEQAIPIYSRIMKNIMDKTIKDAVKKYGGSKRCIP